jgi:MerR family transcriptional regulator/heat shock protein HspR
MAMSRRIIPRDLVAQHLAISPKVLVRYESLGLVHTVHEGSVEGYEPGQVRRLWSIVSFQRDLGINLAGVEVILHLVDQLSEVRERAVNLAEELRALIEADLEIEPARTPEDHD